MTLKDAAELFREKQLECIIVNNCKNQFMGVLTKEDLIDCYYKGIPLDEQIENQVKDCIILSENEEVSTVFNLYNCKVIGIKDSSGKIKGILTQSLILNAFISFISSDLYNEEDVKRKKEIQKSFNKNQLDLEKVFNDLKYLKDLEHELNEIIEFSADSIYVTDGQGNALRVNKAFEKITGIKKEQVLGKNGLDLEKEKIFDPSVTPIVMKEKREVTIIQRINNSRQAIVTGVPVFDENGEIFRIVLNAKSVEDSEILRKYFSQKEEYSYKADQDKKMDQDKLIFSSSHFKELVQLIQKIALVDSTVLLTGESGVGKSFLAQYIHNNSSRAKEKIMEINCGAIPESLLESELFGYEGGAFTGANSRGKPGLIEMANKGSLFLDEIGSMPLNLQVKLLQVIQNRQIIRVGGTEPIKVDIRIIAASNKDIKLLVKRGKFREDLYYRLNVIPIHIEPIRKRKEDIIPLTRHFLDKYNTKYKKKIEFSTDAYEEMVAHNWPGNIREIENFTERMVVTNNSGTIGKKQIENNFIEKEALNVQPVSISRIMPLKEAFYEAERILTIMAYKNNPNSYKMAKLLGISQSTAHRKIQEHIYKNNSSMG